MTLSGQRHQLLKDFLRNDPNSILDTTNTTNQKPAFSKLSRSRSSKAASTTVAVIHKAFNAVKQFQFRMKDILRWRSFMDSVEDESTPFDRNDPEIQWGETCSLEEEELEEEKAQEHSPISILNFHFEEEGDELLSYHKNVKGLLLHDIRRNLLMYNNTQEFESLGSLKSIKGDDYFDKIHYEECNFETHGNSIELLTLMEIDETAISHLLFDFYHNEGFCEENLRKVKTWMIEEYEEGRCELEVRAKKEASVREMDREGKWNKFEEEEKQEIAIEVEIMFFDCLIDELLIDLSCDLE